MENENNTMGIDFVASGKEVYETRERMQRRISESSSQGSPEAKRNAQENDENEFVGLNGMLTNGVIADSASEPDLIVF